MNYLILQIEGQSPILFSSKMNLEETTENLARTISYSWKERERRLLHNYFVLHPEEYVGEEKKRPLTKISIFNDFFKISNVEIALNMFYNFDTRLPIPWSVKKLQISE